jgi:serine/threonine protein kinase
MSSDKPDSEELSDESQRKVEEISDDFLQQLRSGERPDLNAIAEKHRSLAPNLKNRLKLLEAVFLATLSSGRSAPELDFDVEILPDSLEEDSFDIQPPKAGESGNKFLERTSKGFVHREAAHRINCPHCGNLVQLVTAPKAEVTCRSCGSSVFIDDEITANDMAANLPSHIGRFAIKRLLGQGAFGVVYRAFDPQLRREVALKIPRQGYFLSPNEEQRFFREAQSAAKLNHANIVRVHEVSQDLETPFIVSELIEGLTLGDLASGGVLSFREIAELMVQICDAVGHAHKNGVIHRDLKPGNILIDQYRNAFVSDFGLARREDTEITMTVDGMVLGTPAYMSPEQAAGIHNKVNATSDIYSLGVVLYKMLARELPFSGTKRMLLHQVIHDEPKSPRKLNDSIPRDLETITLKAINKSQSERFQSAEEMANELKRWLRGEPIVSRPVGSATRFFKWCRRYPVIASLCGTILGLLIAGSAYAWLTAKHETFLRSVADTNASEATARKEESEARLNQIYQKNGFDSLEKNQLIDSGYWFSKSLELNDTKAGRQRLGMILDQIPALKSVIATDSKVQSLAFSADGRRLAVGTKLGSLKVFEIANQKELFASKTSDGSGVIQLKFLGQTDKLVFNSGKSKATICNVSDGRVVKEIRHAKPISALETTEQGDLLATVSVDRVIKIYTSDGELKKELKSDNSIDSVSFIEGTDLLIVQSTVVAEEISQPKSQFELRNLNTDEIVWQKQLPYPTVFDISNTGTHLLTVSNFQTASVWDTADGNQIGETVKSERLLTRPKLNSDSTFTAIVDKRELQDWDFTTGLMIENPRQIDFELGLVVDEEQERYFAVPDRNGSIVFINRANGAEIASKIPTSMFAPQIRFSPTGNLVAIEAEETTQVWDLSASLPTYREFKHQGNVRNSLFSPDGQRCYTIGRDGKAFIWDTETGNQIGDPMTHDDAILECELSSDGQLFATASADTTAKIWDAKTGTLIGNPLPHESPVLELAFSLDNKKLVTGSAKGEVTCWRVAATKQDSPKSIFTVNQDGPIRRIVFHPTESMFATASMDGSTRIWDSETGIVKYGPFENLPMTYDCDISPDGKKIVTSGIAQVDVWDLVAGEKLDSFAMENGTYDVDFVNNQMIKASDASGSTKIWELGPDGSNTFQLSKNLKHRELPIHNYSDMTAELDQVVVAGEWRRSNNMETSRGSCLVWDLNSAKPIGPPLLHQGGVRRAHFSPNGKSVLSASFDATARLWALKSTELSTDQLIRTFEVLNGVSGSSNLDVHIEAVDLKSFLAEKPASLETSEQDRLNWENLFSSHTDSPSKK